MTKFILAPVTTSIGGQATVHRIVSMTPAGDNVSIMFASFADADRRSPLEQNIFTVTDAEFAGLSYPDGLLAHAIANWFPGGQVVADPSSFEAAKSQARIAVRSQFASRSQAGFTHDFSIGTRTLDLRNADDKSNWTLLLLKAQGKVATGAGSDLLVLRAQDNTTFEIPASEAMTAMQAMLNWGAALYTAKWALDDQVAAAADQAALDAIDLNAGWPA